MSRTCTICSHPDRTAIERSIASGMGYRNIAKQFAVGYSSVSRHASDHIPAAIHQSQAAKEEAGALDVVKQLKDINAIARAIMEKAKDDDEELALKAMDRVFRQLELQAKLLGDLDDRPQVNVWLPAPWPDIESAIADALRPYPQAAAAVAARLVELDKMDHAKLN